MVGADKRVYEFCFRTFFILNEVKKLIIKTWGNLMVMMYSIGAQGLKEATREYFFVLCIFCIFHEARLLGLIRLQFGCWNMPEASEQVVLDQICHGLWWCISEINRPTTDLWILRVKPFIKMCNWFETATALQKVSQSCWLSERLGRGEKDDWTGHAKPVDVLCLWQGWGN